MENKNGHGNGPKKKKKKKKKEKNPVVRVNDESSPFIVMHWCQPSLENDQVGLTAEAKAASPILKLPVSPYTEVGCISCCSRAPSWSTVCRHSSTSGSLNLIGEAGMTAILQM